MNGPLVSVIVAVRNGERFLAESLRSIFAQDYRPLDVIVVDGHSTDRTAEIAASFPQARWLPQKSRGVSDAYNEGVAASRGELVAFNSCDDIWAPGKLRTQVRHLVDHPEIEYVIAHIHLFLENGCAVPPGFKTELFTAEPVGRIMETLLARRSVFDRVGPFDASYDFASDTDWFARAQDLGVVSAILPEVLLHKRIHDRNTSQRPEQVTGLLLRTIKASLDRRRSDFKMGVAP